MARRIGADRPNEVSTQVEKKLQTHLESAGVLVEMPRAASGRGSGSGYPDRLLWHGETPTYLEVKVSQDIQKGGLRSFYFKASKSTKIRHSARHLLAGFAIREQAEKLWVLTEWKIADLFHLRVKLKPEYNADNLEIYRDELILLEGERARGETPQPAPPRNENLAPVGDAIPDWLREGNSVMTMRGNLESGREVG